MNWKLKCFLFHSFETIPFGKKLYYFFQKNITKSVWMPDSKFEYYYTTKIKNHTDAISQYGKTDLSDATLFEFGAGWDMFAPIGFALGNAKRYITVDINPFSHTELIKYTINMFKNHFDYLKTNFPHGENLTMPEFDLDSDDSKDAASFLMDNLGIEYYAPMDAGNTPFPSGCIDYVISNVSLEHIPYEEIDNIFKECHRILSDNGLMSLTIDYTDHYGHTDPSISFFNYMQYSDREWKKYNPDIHYQNRLQHSDYVKLFEKNGFQIIASTPTTKESDREALEKIHLDERFQKYDFEELLYRADHFIVKKA